jgi:ankyrin repeat protein
MSMRKSSQGRSGSKKDDAPLLHALIRDTAGTLKEVEELLKEDPLMIHDRDRLGGTPLHAAVEAGKADIVQYLLTKSGINVNLIDRHGWTPLHTACHRGDLTVIELLLTGGAGGLGTNNSTATGISPSKGKGFGGSNGFDSRSPSNLYVALPPPSLSFPLSRFPPSDFIRLSKHPFL